MMPRRIQARHQKNNIIHRRILRLLVLMLQLLLLIILLSLLQLQTIIITSRKRKRKKEGKYERDNDDYHDWVQGNWCWLFYLILTRKAVLPEMSRKTRILWQKTLLAINIMITTIGIKGTGVELYNRRRIMAMQYSSLLVVVVVLQPLLYLNKMSHNEEQQMWYY